MAKLSKKHIALAKLSEKQPVLADLFLLDAIHDIPKGERGERGPAGESIVGPAGPRGERGSDGRDGRDGVDGKNGRDGESIVGPQGERGEIGPAGKDADPSAVVPLVMEELKKDLEPKLAEIDRKASRVMTPAKAYRIRVADCSSQCDGANKSFNVGGTHFGIVSVSGTDFPVILRPVVDYTETATGFTLTDAVPAPSSGATLVAQFLK